MVYPVLRWPVECVSYRFSMSRTNYGRSLCPEVAVSTEWFTKVDSFEGVCCQFEPKWVDSVSMRSHPRTSER